MKEETIYCDHCGKKLDIMKDFDDVQIEMAHNLTEADLCDECLDELYKVVCDFCSYAERQRDEKM